MDKEQPSATETAAQPRPGWTGFRWGMAAGGIFGGLLSTLIGYFGTIYAAEGGPTLTVAEILPTWAIFFVPTVVVSMLIVGVGGAITLWSVYRLLCKFPQVGRGGAVGIALAICLAFMLLIASPVLAILWSDGNFWRGLEESMIIGIPFYVVPGLFYVVAMILATLRNFEHWFPERLPSGLR